MKKTHTQRNNKNTCTHSHWTCTASHQTLWALVIKQA